MYVTLDQKITVSTTRVALLFVAEVEYADHTYTRRWIRKVSQGYLCDLCHESQHVDDHNTRRLYRLRYVQKNGTMYPRPRRGCQESGLRPIDQSRSVPDKPADGLGTMSWFSTQILICFIAYIFKFPIVLWFGLQTLYFRTVYSLPIVNKAFTKDRKSPRIRCINWKAGRSKPSGIYATGLKKKWYCR